MKLTQSQLIATIEAIQGTTMATIETATDPRLKKTGNPFNGRKVLKHSKLNVQIGASYENGVNRQAGREGNESAGEFKTHKLAYGRWLVPHKLIEHNGKVQLRVTCNPHMKPETHYTVNGQPVDKEEIKPFLPSKKPSQRQEDFGVDRQIVPRNFNMESIKAITVKGSRYEIV